MPKFKSDKELDDYFNGLDYSTKMTRPLARVYFLVRHEDGSEDMVYFESCGTSYLEHPCHLNCWFMADEWLAEYVKDVYKELPSPEELSSLDEPIIYKSGMWVDDTFYDITGTLEAEFIDRETEIVKMVDEVECMRWLLENGRTRRIDD